MGAPYPWVDDTQYISEGNYLYLLQQAMAKNLRKLDVTLQGQLKQNYQRQPNQIRIGSGCSGTATQLGH